MAKLTSKASRIRTHVRVRQKVKGTTERPRLAVNFSGQHIRAQVIDDVSGKTLVSAFTTEKSLLRFQAQAQRQGCRGNRQARGRARQGQEHHAGRLRSRRFYLSRKSQSPGRRRSPDRAQILIIVYVHQPRRYHREEDRRRDRRARRRRGDGPAGCSRG